MQNPHFHSHMHKNYSYATKIAFATTKRGDDKYWKWGGTKYATTIFNNDHSHS